MREVLEETGWTIRDARLLGLAHFQHLTPKPVAYRYPYPNFLHLVYVANADRYDATQREVGRLRSTIYCWKQARAMGPTRAVVERSSAGGV